MSDESESAAERSCFSWLIDRRLKSSSRTETTTSGSVAGSLDDAFRIY